MKRPAHGTLFSVPLPDGTYLCGRIVLDIYACFKRRLFQADSPLPMLGKAFLVEMYSGIAQKPEYIPSSKLIRGAFVDSEALGESWSVIGNLPINPREVEFPESLMGHMHSHGGCDFQNGEISIPLPLPYSTTDQVGEVKRRNSSYLWYCTCLRAMGRGAEVPQGYEGATLAGSDLRNSLHRSSIYRHLPFPMEMSHYDKQKQMGFDLERFYT